MKKILIALSALAGAMVVSCTGDTGGEGDGGAAIVFRSLPASRVSGGLATTDNLSEIAVFASRTTGDWEETTATPNFMYNQTVTKSDGVWTYTPVKYWPSVDSPERVSFMAISPAPSGTNGIAVATGVDVAGYPAFTVTPPASPSQQADFCVATPVMNTTADDTNGSAAGDGGGKVSFDFDHTMAKVTFSAKYIYDTPTTQPDVHVDAIELSGLAASNTLRITGAGYAWDTPADATGSYGLSADDGELSTAALTTGKASISTATGALCLVPQIASGAMAQLVVSFNGAEYEVKAALPTSTWEAGKSYDYSLNISADGYELEEPASPIVGTNRWNFAYTGKKQEFTVPQDGYYKLEAWGARGGAPYNASFMGNGGYVGGIIYLKQNQQLYVYVGQYNNTRYGTTIFNGGGIVPDNSNSGRGGGATDFRFVPGDSDAEWDKPLSLNSRIMVAGGGGGCGDQSSGVSGGQYGHAGGLKGWDQYYPQSCGGTQTSGGAGSGGYYGKGTFGRGGTPGGGTNYLGGGGGGYYGGAGNGYSGGDGSGGSSFISSMTGCVAIDPESTAEPRAQDSGTGLVKTALNYNTSLFGASPTFGDGEDILFTDCSMVDGGGYQWNTGEKATTAGTMPNPSGGTMTGNTGNGYARITLFGIKE